MNVTKTIVTSFIVLCVFCNRSMGQDLIKSGQLLGAEGYVNIMSSVVHVLDNYGIDYKLQEWQTNFDFDAPNKLYYVVEHKPNLLYYEGYYDDKCEKIKETGYFSFYYANTEFGYVWVRDLTWLFFTNSGEIEKTQFYSNGTEMSLVRP